MMTEELRRTGIHPTSRGPCIHEEGGERCGVESASRIVIGNPEGRPPSVGGPYCAAHGGDARAIREAEADWNHAAPTSVGDAAAVLAAGTMHLDSTHAYVVVRRADNRAGKDDTWLAWLGIGSRQVQVRRVKNARADERGTCSFVSRGQALICARYDWEERLKARVAEIRAARGGTLEWGLPVEPLEAPVVIELGPGQNAWDVALTVPRVGREVPRPVFLTDRREAGFRASGEVI